MPSTKNQLQKREFAAELLKERIYVTFALVAVLASINTNHTSPFHAEFIVGGTIVSLWAASIVATIMSRRLVLRGQIDHDHEIRHQIRVHSPMLLALVTPLFLMTLSAMDVIALSWAVNISIFSSLLLLASWSIMSAKTLGAKKVPTFILILLQLAIGAGIILLKIVAGH